MRKVVGLVLALLGAFLVTAAVVALTWAPGVVKKTPIDVDSVTVLSGTGGKVDLETGEVPTGPVAAKSVTKSDSKASTDETAVFTNYACAVYGQAPDVPCIKDGTDPARSP